MRQTAALGLGARALAFDGRAIMNRRREAPAAATMETERELFWEWLEPLQKKLYNFLHKALNFSEEASDLFQEVVLRAWRYFGSYDRQRNFSTWIFAIAHNEIKKHFGGRGLQDGPVPLSDLSSDPPAAGSDPVVERITSVAQHLPPRQREVFFLFYYNHFLIADIAEITGLRTGNIKFILSSAREAVRQALEVKHEK